MSTTGFVLLLAVSAALQTGMCIAATIRGFIHGADGHEPDQAGLAIAAYRAGRWARRRRDEQVRRALATPLRKRDDA